MVILSIFILLSCSNKANTNHLPISQKLFCNAIDSHKDKYQAITDKDKYIDQKADLAAIFTQRNNALNSILKDGHVDRWVGVIDDMTITSNGVYIKVQLPCNAHLSANDSLIITTDSTAYQSLKSYSENSDIVFSGQFLLSNNMSSSNKSALHYSIDNFTDHTSMMNPGFYFKYTQLHK